MSRSYQLAQALPTVGISKAACAALAANFATASLGGVNGRSRYAFEPGVLGASRLPEQVTVALPRPLSTG